MMDTINPTEAAVQLHDPMWRKLLADKAYGRILQLAAGEGRLTESLVEQGSSVWAVDDSESALAELQSRRWQSVRALQINVRRQLPRWGEFDFAACGLWLHTLNDQDLASVLKSVACHLKLGGGFLASVPDPRLMAAIAPEFIDEHRDETQVLPPQATGEGPTQYFRHRARYARAIKGSGMELGEIKESLIDVEGLPEPYASRIGRPAFVFFEAKRL